MDHFRLLPTDPRIKRLADEQAEILFMNHMRLPSSDALKRRYSEEKRREKAAAEFPEDDFKAMGYSDEAIEEIKRSAIV
jgi:chemotaxis receptor (MCP) glutamine deamidase CheD